MKESRVASTVAVGREGLIIDDKPFFMLSGCVHYFRWPRAEWRPLLEQARWAGLNTIDTVIPWNLHEPRPGEFHFADEADLGAYLDLCAELGLYAIVRPGPYICAEWENGGLPAWLTSLPGIRLRVDDAQYMQATRRWLDTLMSIITPRQATRGGAVILCQIENEHWASGVYGSDMHQQSLSNAAIERGIEVPQYTCMGAMSEWPEFRNGWSGIAEKLVQTRALWPENPMIVSELWSGWFDSWGASRETRKRAEKLDVTLHQLTAVGCSGISHWMWAGGTNFGFWGGRTVGGDIIHMTTSYDYDAPIDEYGRLTTKALVARRHHLFLGTMGATLSPILADAVPGGMTVIAPAAVRGRSEGGSAPYRTVKAGPGAPVAWHDFCAGFLQNPSSEGQTHQVFLKQPARHLSVAVEPFSIRPIYANLPLADGLRIVCHTGRILGFWPRPGVGTLVIYGQPGEVGEIELEVKADEGRKTKDESSWQFDQVNVPTHLVVTPNGRSLHIRYWITAEPSEIQADAGDYRLSLVILDESQASLYEPLPPPHPQPLSLKGRGESDHRILSLERLPVSETVSDTGWQSIDRLEALERLGCDYGYGWYRAELELDTAVETTIVAPALSDRARVLVDGIDIGWLGVGPDAPHYALPLRLDAGRHELRLLVDNLGRFNYGLNLGELKGLLDTLYLGGEQHDLSAGWSALWQEALSAGEAIATANPRALRPDAADVHLGHFAYEGPSVWLLREFEAPAGRRYLLHMTGDRNSGALFVNGQAVERFSRHRSGGIIKADISQALRPGANVLALNIQGYAGAAWRATLLSYDPAQAISARWSFRAGVTPEAQSAKRQAPSAGPAFYKAGFDRAAVGGAATLRLRMAGLRKGQIWLNGRNIGRYWQIGPQEDYKLPVSWLAEQNELLIFAEEGHAENVTLILE